MRSALKKVIERAVDANADKKKFPRTWLFHRRWGKNSDAVTARGEKIVHITVDDRVEEAARLLVQVKGITKVDMTNHNGTVRLDVTIDLDSGLPISELPNRLIAQGFRISSLQQEQVNLETAFMRLTKGLVS